MNSLEYRSFGKTGLQVGCLGLGCTSLGGLYQEITDEEATQTVHRSLERGCNLFDTAPFYGSGKSEIRLGEALASVPRDRFILATKVGRVLEPATDSDRGKPIFVNPLPYRPVFDFGYDAVMRSFEESLKRLNVDRIDILHLHDPDDHYQQALDEAFPALAALRSQGAIGAISAGMKQWQMLARFAQAADFDCFLLAGRYTLLDQSAMDEFFPICQRRAIGIILGGTYNSGILATGAIPGAKYEYADAPAAILERVQRMEAICAIHGVSLKAAALQFPLAHPAVATIVPGAAHPSQVDENIDLLNQPIPTDLWAALKSEGLLRADAPVPSEKVCH
jgi:D-threo-aldose 1-dehydrogenase